MWMRLTLWPELPSGAGAAIVEAPKMSKVDIKDQGIQAEYLSHFWNKGDASAYFYEQTFRKYTSYLHIYFYIVSRTPHKHMHIYSA